MGTELPNKDLANLHSEKQSSERRTGQFGRPARNLTSNKSSSNREGKNPSTPSKMSFGQPSKQVQVAVEPNQRLDLDYSTGFNKQLDSPVSMGDKQSFPFPLSSPGHTGHGLSTQPSADWKIEQTNQSKT